MEGAAIIDRESDETPVSFTPTSQDAYPHYAFLVHSQSTLMQDLPPKVDTAMTARQKRRRTSPEDHTMLEAAYQKNSKPDKSERIEIVKRVTLSEKEVQIWFQNRRQNDRRKSRPLLPHEMVPHFRNSVPQVLLDSGFPKNTAPAESHRAPWCAGEIPCATGGDEPERSSSRSSSIHELLNPTSSIESHTTTSSDLLSAEKDWSQTSQSLTPVFGRAVSDMQALTEGDKDMNISSRDSNSPPGRVKRSHDEMTEMERNVKDVTVAHVPSLSSHSSHVRLSMSVEGAVKIKMDDAETPSPPKQRAPAPTTARKLAGGLQRSKSATVLGVPVSKGSAGSFKVKSIGAQFGRSRDARTWEFYCDGDAREALSTYAENERAGSAVGAINLIRSQSQKSRLQVMTERMGTSSVRNPPLSQRGVKPKLSRAKSSTGRLQDTDQSAVTLSMKDGKSLDIRSPSSDSDKENWAPGTRSTHHPSRRQHTSINRHPVPGGEHYTPSQAKSISGPPTGARKGNVTKQPAAMDKENTIRFSQRKTLIEEGGKGEDLDCIQGLLSLSQGAWR